MTGIYEYVAAEVIGLAADGNLQSADVAGSSAGRKSRCCALNRRMERLLNNNPSSAVAQCNDDGYSHAARRIGACSRRDGVAKWIGQ